MLRRTEGIVLRSMEFGEADLIVTFMTRDFGLMKAFAKSPRKTKSRFGSSLEPLTRSHIGFWGKEDAQLPRLTQSDIIESNHQLRDNLKFFIESSWMSSAVLALIPEGQTHADVFELMNITLGLLREMIEAGNERGLSTVGLAFKVKMVDIAGYSPAMDKCIRCGGRSASYVLLEGRVLCEDCGKTAEGRSVISQGAVNVYETMRTWEMDRVLRIRPSAGMIKEIKELLDSHMKSFIKKGT